MKCIINGREWFYDKKTAQTTFQLYQGEHGKLKSTFFDLIDGNLETKQTKGLAYLFSLSPAFLKRFLKVDKTKSRLKESSKESKVIILKLMRKC